MRKGNWPNLSRIYISNFWKYEDRNNITEMRYFVETMWSIYVLGLEHGASDEQDCDLRWLAKVLRKKPLEISIS